MTLEQWTQAGEIAASAAVIASLVYLGVQVRQSNALSRAQTSQIMIQMARQEILAVPEIWTTFTKETLSPEEKLKLHHWTISAMRQREYEWLASKEDPSRNLWKKKNGASPPEVSLTDHAAFSMTWSMAATC